MSRLIPMLAVVTSLAFESNPTFTWSSSTVSIGSNAYGTSSIYVCPTIIVIWDDDCVFYYRYSYINFAVLTNYTVNGVQMHPFAITSTEVGIPPVNVQPVTWQGHVYWGAQYQSIVPYSPPMTVGYTIQQPIPNNHALIGQHDWGIAGALNLNITCWWDYAVPQIYASEAICITSWRF